jgi:hypothetical protein
MNISKDVVNVAKNLWKEKCKRPQAKTKKRCMQKNKLKGCAKATSKPIMKKWAWVVECFSNIEILLRPSNEALYNVGG